MAGEEDDEEVVGPGALRDVGEGGGEVVAAGVGVEAEVDAVVAEEEVGPAEAEQRESLEHQIQAILAFLGPFFFVVTGAQVELGQLGSPSDFGVLLLVTLLAVIGKLVGCGVGALPLGKRSALIVGVGMIPRGEVGIIVASLGQQAGVFTGATYAIIIAMSLLTSVIAPPVLKRLLAGSPSEDSPQRPEEAGADPSLLVPVEETGHE